MSDGGMLVDKATFDRLQEFLHRPEIWSQRGSAQIAVDLRYLEWTTEPPTVPGWYWVYEKYQAGNYTEKTRVVLLYLNSEAVFQYEPDNTEDFPDEDGFIQYLGPLPVPEPPKE